MTDELATYLVIFKQAGEGCDYTIACGTKVVTVPANSVETAFLGALDVMGWEPDQDYWDDEYAMESVVIVRAAEINIDLFDQHRASLRKIKERNAQLEIDKAEFAEYERLKEKFADRETFK